MLYHVVMDVNLPVDMPKGIVEDIKLLEKTYSQTLQREGKWRHIWRITGEYANISIFDVSSHDELHDILSNLPLFPYMTIKVTPLARHPSAVE